MAALAWKGREHRAHITVSSVTPGLQCGENSRTSKLRWRKWLQAELQFKQSLSKKNAKRAGRRLPRAL
jgi:hypothetical protein